MDFPSVLLAARHQQGDPAIQAIGAVVMVGLCVVFLLRELTANYDVVTKSGAPYCPRCNRQVSFRRDHCRCCGYRFKSYGTTSGPSGGFEARMAAHERARVAALQAEADRKARVASMERIERAREAKAVEKAERRALRDDAYRAKGIEPGPLAWYRALPDVTQAIVLGLASGHTIGLRPWSPGLFDHDEPIGFPIDPVKGHPAAGWHWWLLPPVGIDPRYWWEDPQVEPGAWHQ